MAIYRTVQLSFWTDEKVLDDFTPEDKYFYLYLFTNPQTNMCGCYELGWTQTTSQLGYSKDSISHLLDRFEKVHKVIRYSKDTKEVLILNWGKYNWQGGNQISCIEKEIENIKDAELKGIATDLFNEKFDTNKPLVSPLQATVTVTDTVTDNISNSIKEIIDYLNSICNTNYKSKTANTKKHIQARLNEGYTVDDFKTVIDKKAKEWLGTDMERYLRPDTLFGTKFEGYLNQKIVKPNGNGKERDLLQELWEV